MISALIHLIETVLIPLGAFGVFGALFLEEVIFLIPSSLVMLGTGFFLLSGDPLSPQFLSTLFFIIVLPSALGATIGSFLIYGILYRFGKPALERFGKYLGIFWGDIEKANEWFTGTYADEIVIFFLRAIPVVPNSVVSALGGLIRMHFLRYCLLTFLGIMVRALILGVIGWEAGELYREYAAVIDRFENYILLAFAFCLLVLLVFMRRRREKKVSS